MNETSLLLTRASLLLALAWLAALAVRRAGGSAARARPRAGYPPRRDRCRGTSATAGGPAPPAGSPRGPA